MLVAIPMVFNLLFIGVLNKLLSDAQRDAERATEARLIVSHINRMLSTVMQAAGGVGVSVLSNGTVNRTTDAEVQLHQEMDILRHLMKDKPAQEQQTFERMFALAEEGSRDMARIKQTIKHGAGLESLPLIKKMQPILRKIVDECNSIIIVEEKIDEAGPQIDARNRGAVQTLLLVGVLINILFAGILATFFNRSTTRKLRVLFENSIRFSMGKPLLA
ncbi:MAG: hypothetical protein ACRD3W_11425, partial [Terriglobales bacterium]